MSGYSRNEALPLAMASRLMEAQRLWLSAWGNVATLGLRGLFHEAQVSNDFLRHPVERRSRNEPPRGADLTNHYGRRAHDVDAEHLR